MESDRLDFKTLGRSREDSLIDLAEVAACLANSKGGHIIVGVADADRGQSALVGSDLDEIRTQRRIYVPGLIVTVTSEMVAGRRLTVISVPRSPDIHQVKAGRRSAWGRHANP